MKYFLYFASFIISIISSEIRDISSLSEIFCDLRTKLSKKPNIQAILSEIEGISSKIHDKNQFLRSKELESQALSNRYDELIQQVNDMKEQQGKDERENKENKVFSENFNKMLGNSRIMSGFLQNINENLEKTDKKIQNSLTSNFEKKNLVNSEIEAYKLEIDQLNRKNGEISLKLDNEKSDFEGFLADLQKIQEETQQKAIEIKHLKGDLERIDDKSHVFIETNTRLKTEKTIEEGKLSEISSKIANFTQNLQNLKEKAAFYGNMLRKVRKERLKKIEFLRDIQGKITDSELRVKNTMLDSETKRISRSNLLEELKDKSEVKLKIFDEKLEKEKEIEKEKRGKVDRLEDLAEKIRIEMEKIKQNY